MYMSCTEKSFLDEEERDELYDKLSIIHLESHFSFNKELI